MSGQCLSPNDAGHALTPATHRCLGEPLPHQQANRMQAPPLTESHLWSEDIIRYYLQFPAAIPDRGVGTYTLLSLSPLSIYRSKLLARLACLIHAANVHSEPESNPSIDWLISAEADVLPNRTPLPQSNGYRRLILYFKNSFIPTCYLTKANASARCLSAKQAVPVTIACRPKPKEINNQIVKDHFRYHNSDSGNIER